MAARALIMATLEQENSCALDLTLSLGGLFSQLPCTRLQHSSSPDSYQQARTSVYQEHTSDDDSSSHLSIASCSIPTSNPEALSLTSHKSMKESDGHLPINGSAHRILSGDAKKALVPDQEQCGFGSTSIISHPLPTKRKSSFENEDGTISRNSSAESENGDNPDEGSTSRKRALTLEAPQSRCGSSSDLVGSVDPIAEKMGHSSMMYMNPSAMLPVQGPYSVPVQWGFNHPYPMQYYSHMVPPHLYFPWITPFVPNSSSGLRPSVPAPACPEGKPEETICKEATVTTAPSSENKVLQVLSQIRESPLAAVPTAMPLSESEVCTSASSLRPSCSISPAVNCSSDVCTWLRDSLSSATSLMTDCSSDSFKEVDLVKEESESNVSFSHPTREGCLKSVLCHQKFHRASLQSNSTGKQSKHSSPSGQKPTKSVRFCCDESEPVKSVNSKKILTSSSFNMRNQLRKKMQAIGKEVRCTFLQRNSCTSNRITEECREEEDSDDSRITSESWDQYESGLLVKGKGGAGKCEAEFAASWPKVSTTCAGLNGKTIHGVMYITESKQVSLICSCHGTHMSPSEFVQHSGSTDLQNPERSIVISGFPNVKQGV